MAAVLFFSLIAMGYVVLQYANNPQIKAITVTASVTPTVTASATTPPQAPWLEEDDDEDIDETPTPNSDSSVVLPTPDGVSQPGVTGRTQEQWNALLESYGYQCNPQYTTGNTVTQDCNYQDTEHDINIMLKGSDTIMPENIEIHVTSTQSEELPTSETLDTLIIEKLAPVIAAPVAPDQQQAAADWFVKEASNLVLAGRENDFTETFGDQTILIEYSYFLRIEL